MKKKTLSILMVGALAGLLTSSCSDWLDVQPTTEKDREDLITTDEGFKQMLYGTYINLVDPALYGHQLTYGFLEGLARNYVWNPQQNYDYKDNAIRPTIDAVWSKMYNNVANVNSILKDIDSHLTIFRAHEGELLKGEALAMRAFMHFDLLRMFAPRYQGNEETLAIPYVETYERVRYPHLTEKLVAEKILADLNAAEQLLLEADDPILHGRELLYSGKGDFLANRPYRFNYWAVIALKARVYLYLGQTGEALAHAQRVIREAPFTWVDEAAVIAGDRIFIPEMICGLNVPKLANYYESYFKSEKYSLSDGWGTYGLNVFGDANDYRFLYLFTEDKSKNKVLSCKYDQTTGPSKAMLKETVPLIRLGEMYLIAAECQADSNPQESIRLLRELKLHRGYLATDRGIADGADASQVRSYVREEMHKELYAEGQMFFYYKRIDSPTTPGFSPWWAGATTAMKTAYYTFSLPESEVEYGNIPATPEAGNEPSSNK